MPCFHPRKLWPGLRLTNQPCRLPECRFLEWNQAMQNLMVLAMFHRGTIRFRRHQRHHLVGTSRTLSERLPSRNFVWNLPQREIVSRRQPLSRGRTNRDRGTRSIVSCLVPLCSTWGRAGWTLNEGTESSDLLSQGSSEGFGEVLLPRQLFGEFIASSSHGVDRTRQVGQKVMIGAP